MQTSRQPARRHRSAFFCQQNLFRGRYSGPMRNGRVSGVRTATQSAGTGGGGFDLGRLGTTWSSHPSHLGCAGPRRAHPATEKTSPTRTRQRNRHRSVNARLIASRFVHDLAFNGGAQGPSAATRGWTVPSLASATSTGKPELGSPFRAPDDDIDPFGEMQQRRWLANVDSVKFQYAVALERGSCRLERPGMVMDLAAPERATGGRSVQTVPLGQPVLERATDRFVRR